MDREVTNKINQEAAIPSHLRCRLLLTFIHCEREGRSAVTRELLRDRMLTLFSKDKIGVLIICTEPHKDGGIHFHVGVLMLVHVSRHLGKKKIREAFPSHSGKALEIQYRRGWPVICSYVTKEDPEFLVWGAGVSREAILEQASFHRNHKSRQNKGHSLFRENKGPSPIREKKKAHLKKVNLFFLAKPCLYIFLFHLFREIGPIIDFIFPQGMEYFFPTPLEPTTLEKIKGLASAAGWRIFKVVKYYIFGGD